MTFCRWQSVVSLLGEGRELLPLKSDCTVADKVSRETVFSCIYLPKKSVSVQLYAEFKLTAPDNGRAFSAALMQSLCVKRTLKSERALNLCTRLAVASITITSSSASCMATSWLITSNHIHAGVELRHFSFILPSSSCQCCLLSFWWYWFNWGLMLSMRCVSLHISRRRFPASSLYANLG